jgi:cyclic pyranopterin monophosphate synthase
MTAPDERAKALGAWLTARRKALGLTRPEVVAAGLRQRPHAALSQNYLAKLEDGDLDVASAALEVREALRLGLDLSRDAWMAGTGLHVPEEATAPALTPNLTHFVDGQPRMVDVSAKPGTARAATAEAWVVLPPEARAALTGGQNKKGDPLTVARLAAIGGAKRTSDVVLLCHPLPIAGVDVDVQLQDAGVHITATVRTSGPTGVEMEALTAVTVAALNVYDMLKAASKAIQITGVRLLAKSGGKSGDYRAE